MKVPEKIFHSVLAIFFMLLLNSPAKSTGFDTVNSLYFENSIESFIPLNARWSFSALDLETGRKIISAGNAQDTPLIPGSCMKLYLTAAILDMYAKENFAPVTVFAHDGFVSQGKLFGNLYLKGSGDAFISERDLRNASEEVISTDIREIIGNIVLDDLLFDTKDISRTYSGPAYTIPAALGIDMHTVSITAVGNPVNFKVNPKNDEVKIIMLPGRKPAIRQINDLTYEFSGPVSDAESVKFRFPLKDPSRFAALTFHSVLKSRGIAITGEVLRGEMPGNTAEVHQISSKSIPDRIRDINFNSLNVAADNLFLVIGAKRFGVPGTLAKGSLALTNFVQELGVRTEGLSITDGSGLSPDNRTTSYQIAEFLTKASEQNWFKHFYESFPRAGLDGTLRNTGYENERIRAKTGQLRDAFCIAGYADRKNQSKIAFAFIVNVPGADLLWGNSEIVFTLIERIADEKI